MLASLLKVSCIKICNYQMKLESKMNKEKNYQIPNIPYTMERMTA